MRDHNAPELHTLISFCDKAKAFLNASPQNVVAVHCQGGKGRTGLFCSALMLWTGFRLSAGSCLDMFASRRTDAKISTKPLQGVAAPCQIRYAFPLG